jgi:hypothetical protein
MQGISKFSQASAVARLSASLKTRLGGSFSVLGADNPVSFEEHETGRQLIEAAKVWVGWSFEWGVLLDLSSCGLPGLDLSSCGLPGSAQLCYKTHTDCVLSKHNSCLLQLQL